MGGLALACLVAWAPGSAEAITEFVGESFPSSACSSRWMFNRYESTGSATVSTRKTVTVMRAGIILWSRRPA